MAEKLRLAPVPALIFALFLASPVPGCAQLVLGQYEDEAPLRTWNTFPLTTAPSLGLAESQFALVQDCSVALANPALLPYLSRFSVTLNGSSNLASLFKYGLVNTGVAETRGNPSLRYYALDFAGLAFVEAGWALSLSLSLTESYDRPRFQYELVSRDIVNYAFNFQQTGTLRCANIALSRKLGSVFSAGIAVNYVWGSLEREMKEEWFSPKITIADIRSQKFAGFYLNGGIFLSPSSRLGLAFIFRTPHIKKSEGASLIRYIAPAGQTDIQIHGSGRDEARQPLVIGAGAAFKFTPQFRLASDVAFYNWANYRLHYFGEEKDRIFKNIVKASLGGEYLSSSILFGQSVVFPVRLGISYDPQPMRLPNSFYYYYALGTGIHWKSLHLDLGALFGREKGSGNSLIAQKVAVSLNIQL
jgi:hypothetical protein